MLLIQQDSPEWEFMWNWLAIHPINENIAEPSVAVNSLNGEAWQYMGSYRQDTRVVHEFRHRSHPLDNDRKHLVCNASDLINQSIEKVIQIKS